MAIVRLVDKRTGEEVLDGDMIDVESGESQAIAAAKLGNVGDLKLLHERHANFDYQDADGWTALMTACATHHVDCALYLISCNANLELAAKDGWTALMIAIDHNQEEIVKALLDAGAKTGRFNYSGACELCITAKYPRLTKLLLEHGANPNQPHPKLPLVKPLFLTLSHCKDAHPDFVRMLVKHGAEVNAQTKEGQTPLMVSVMNAGITKVLLECGADPSLRDQDGETALDYAKKLGVDQRAYEILNTAMHKMYDGRNAKDNDISIIAERIGKRYDEICAYFRDNPFGSNPSDLTILSLLPPVDRCLIIERILKLDNSDRLTCIDKLSMAYLKAGLRDVAFEFIKQCDKCGWFNNQPSRDPYPQWDYDFFADKLNGLVIGNVSACYDDTLRKFPEYDFGSRFCRLVKQLSIEYKGREVLKGDESLDVLKKFHDERLAYIKGLTNKSNPIEVNSAKGEQTVKQEMGVGVGNPLNEAMQDKDIERKTNAEIDKKVSPTETEKSTTNEAIFTSETNCTINIDDIKSLTIFCDKYGATLTVGDTQLIAWYKVNLKFGKRATGAYAFEGYAYISGKDFLKLKPILLKRGWEFHGTKSGPPWFVEGESAVYPKEAEIPGPPVNEVQRIDDGIDSDNCAGKNEDIRVTTTSDQPQSTKDEDPTIEKKSAKRGCVVWLCVICLIAIIGGVVWLFKDELPKAFSDTLGITASKNECTETANQGQIVIEEPIKEEEGRTREQQVAMQLLLQQKASAEQQKKQMIEASQAAKEAGAETYAVSEWEQGNVARKLGDNMFDVEAYEEAKKFYSEAENHFKMATELAVSNAEVRQQKKRMMDASQAAKEAGAKEYAVREWNKGVAAWNYGDDMAKAETYELAKEYYSKAENYFNAAELAASKVEAKKMLDVLPSLEARAADLIRNNERWFKMSVNASELTSMGDELADAWNKINVLNGPGLGQGFTDKDDIKLKALMEKCYILASDAGDGVAAYKLYRLYGGADKSMPIAKNILTNDQNLAESYLDKAVQRNNPDAMKIIALRNYRSMEQASRIAENMNARKCATRIWNDAVGNWDAGNDFFAKGEYLMAIKYYNNAERLFVQARGGNND